MLFENQHGLTTNQIFEHIHNLKETAKHEHIRGRISEMTKRGLLCRNGSTINLTEKGIDYHNKEILNPEEYLKVLHEDVLHEDN